LSLNGGEGPGHWQVGAGWWRGPGPACDRPACAGAHGWRPPGVEFRDGRLLSSGPVTSLVSPILGKSGKLPAARSFRLAGRALGVKRSP